MANPRKFSEKIALHTHRQAEETARFEQIMREVSDVTARVAPDRRTSNKNTLRINTQSLGTFRGGSLPNVSAGEPGDPTVKPIVQKKEKPTVKPNEEVQQPRTVTYRSGSRARSQGGPMRRPHDRRLDTSPYSSGPFLSPPPDTSWRRTNSDSALHQSAMQGMNADRNDNCWMGPTMNGPDRNDGRPRSSCEMPRVPGIHIHPSAHDPGMIQIPICGNNTGSLPDLTNVDFSSPIHAPLDQDQDGSSPYSSSPVNTSPSTLSPTSIPQGVRPQGRFQFTPVSHAHSNHLSVPVNSRYHRHPSRENVQLEKNVIDGSDFSQLSNITGMYHYQHSSPTSTSPTLQQAAAYRSPRPSPQSSPSLGGRHSAPCSPGAPSPLPNDYAIFNQHTPTQFQQQFDQLSMDWAQLVASLLESGCTWSAQLQLDPPVNNLSYVEQNTNDTISQMLPEVSQMGNIELTSDGGYYSTSPSQLVYPNASPSMHTPNTPNTPTSIPNIILTPVDDITRQDISTQLGCDFFDETIREDLGTLDFDSIQVLSSPGITLPDGMEDNFKLDRS